MENTRDLFKKIGAIKRIFNDLDIHVGMITHLEPDILECKVKWALGSITTNKPSGGDRIPASYSKS